MPDGRQSTPIRDERNLRENLDRLGKQARSAMEDDLIVEFPRRLLIRSPNGHYWAIGVTDAGVLTTTDIGDMPT